MTSYKSKICKYSGELEIECGTQYQRDPSARYAQFEYSLGASFHDGELSLTASGTWSDGHVVLPAEAARELADFILRKLEEA